MDNQFQPEGRIIAVTGAARGIGAALARTGAERGARAVAVCDLDADAAAHTAAAIARATGVRTTAFDFDVADEAAVAAAIERIEATLGEIDLYCSNAGILLLDTPDWTVYARPASDWQRAWEVNVMAHVHACRALLPRMCGRGGGAFLVTASAAGLLSQIGGAVYATTKHAALGFAESIAITHGDDGIYAAALCPQAVDTAMLQGVEGSTAAIDGVLAPAELAARTYAAMAAGEFLIRPHPQVAGYVRAKAAEPERWIAGMRRLRARQLSTTGRPL